MTDDDGNGVADGILTPNNISVITPTLPRGFVAGQVIDATTGQALESFNGHKGAVKALVFNGEKFISASADKTARVWNIGIE